jgi:hypothetical protein
MYPVPRRLWYRTCAYACTGWRRAWYAFWAEVFEVLT